MDEEHKKYIMKKIESAVKDYTTMSEDDLCAYILFYVGRLLDDKGVD